jgi:hypothetical protein
MSAIAAAGEFTQKELNLQFFQSEKPADFFRRPKLRVEIFRVYVRLTTLSQQTHDAY